MIQNEKAAFFAQYAHNTDNAVLEIIWQAKETRATRLDLGNCGLTELPDALFELTWLETLILSNRRTSYTLEEKELELIRFDTQNKGERNRLKFISPKIRLLRGLKNLIAYAPTNVEDLSRSEDLNDLSDLSPLKDSTSLKLLDLRNTQVSDLSHLKDLKSLQQLDISSTQVSDLYPLKDLTALQKLSISSTQVSNLYPLKDLTALQKLSIDETSVSDLSPLSNLTALQKLFINNTQVSDLSALKDLTALQKLFGYNTQVSDLSPLRDLMTLQELSISRTQVSDLSSLKGLTALQKLTIEETQVSDLSPLSDLTALQELWISKTLVSDLSPLKGLTALQTLIARSTSLSDLNLLKDLTNLQLLNVPLCPIQYIPKEIYNQGNCANDLFAYWQDLEQSKAQKNNQLKIMFLGNGCVGKTTLLHWFLDNAFKELSLEDGRTHGIIIQPYQFKDSDVLAHFWDFGGQEVYHATHRLFLGRRSLYLLVWATESPDAAHEERHPPQYWLDMIADIGGNERSRVLIVQNLFDGQTERNILTDAQRQDYEKRGLDITTYCINAKTGVKIKSLTSAIEEEAEQLIKTNIEELPTSWVKIRKAVADKRLAKDKTLAKADFENICRDCGLTTDPNVILGYLHRAGELFHYKNQFDNQIILDQEWALKAVYAVLKRDRIERYKGVFTLEDLKEFWQKDNPNLTDEEAKIFLNFMLANKTMFYTEGGYQGNEKNPEFVVPQLLPTTEPNRYRTWQRITDKTRHRIQYAFLHRDIIERFIVATAHLSKNKDYWRNGLFIEYGEDEAMIEVVTDAQDDKIKYIHIECTSTTQTELLKTIREEFNKIRTLDKAKEYRFTNGNWEQIAGEMIYRAEDLGGFKEKAPIFAFPISSQLKTNDGMKQHLLDLIADGKLKEALDLMRQMASSQNSYFNDELIGYLSRFNRNERDNNKRVLSSENYQMEYNRIENATKDLLNSEFDERKVPASFKIPEKQATPPSDNIVITKTISVPKDFKGGVFQNVVSPMIFTEASVLPPQTQTKKVLFLGANPFNTGKLNLKEEYAEIARQLEDKKDVLNLKSEFCTDLESFQKETNNFRPNIIHFAGHGSDSNGELEAFGRGIAPDDTNWKENTGLIFHESGYGAAVLINDATLDYNFETFIEADQIPIEVIVLNACYSTNQADVLSKRVKYVVGVHNSIADGASIDFSAGFYYGLSDGKNVEAAFRYGKGRAMPKLKDRNQIVLFVDGVQSRL
jgi:internalin A